MMRRLPNLVLVVVLALLLAACGNASSPDTTATGGATGGGGGSGGDQVRGVDARLAIRITNVGGQKGAGIPVPTGLRCTKSIPATCTGELACSAGSATDNACTYLAAHRDELFQPIPAGQACTEIYGGPEQATIAGTLDGKPVKVTLARSNGCEISRWELHQPLWGAAAPQGQ